MCLGLKIEIIESSVNKQFKNKHIGSTFHKEANQQIYLPVK